MRCFVLYWPRLRAPTSLRGLRAYVEADYAIALKEWRPLADQGESAAQFFVGLMYAEGKGVTRGYAEAVRWYQLSGNARYRPLTLP